MFVSYCHNVMSISLIHWKFHYYCSVLACKTKSNWVLRAFYIVWAVCFWLVLFLQATILLFLYLPPKLDYAHKKEHGSTCSHKRVVKIHHVHLQISGEIQQRPAMVTEKLSRLRTWPGSNSARHTSLGCLWWDRQWQLDVGMDEKCLEDLALSLWCWFMCFVCFILGEILETGLPQHVATAMYVYRHIPCATTRSHLSNSYCFC
jgi:hypothetical protein